MLVIESQFFKTKFPELAKNPFTITGESYAGVYVPTLSREILDNAPEINLVSIAVRSFLFHSSSFCRSCFDSSWCWIDDVPLQVGDPCTDNDAQQQSMDMLWYSHKHGFVPDADYELLSKHCGAKYPSPLSSGQHTAASLGAAGFRGFTMEKQSPECIAANRKFQASTSKGISQGWPLAWLNDLSLYGPAAVVDSGAVGSLNFEVAKYMMRADVKKAMHTDVSPNPAWPGPGDNWCSFSAFRSQIPL